MRWTSLSCFHLMSYRGVAERKTRDASGTESR